MSFGEVLREFGVKVGLDFDGKQVDKAHDKIEKFATELRSFALAASGLTAGLFAIQNGFTSNSRALTNQASLLGISTEELQANEYAAKVLADVNRDELVASYQKLGDTMDQARAGNVDARKSLEQIGAMSGKMGLILNRLNDPTYKVTEAFHDMAGGIQAIAKNSPLAASRIVEQTLGNAKLLNVLKQGPKILDDNLEAGRKNFALSDAMIKQGNQMDIQMSKLWMTFRKFGYEIGFSVMKHLTPMINEFTKWFNQNKKMIALGINTFLDALADILKIVWEDVVYLTKALGPMVEYLGGARNAVNLLIGAFIAWKALQVTTSFIDMAGAILKLVPALTTIAPALFNAAKAMKALTLVEGIADVVPAMQLLGTGIVTALTPALPILLALAAAGVALHEVMAAMRGEDGWGVKALNWATGHGGGGNDKPFDPSAPSVFGNAKPMPGMNGMIAPGQGDVTQENHFHTENNISVPQGTTSTAAAHMISHANIQSNEAMLRKAKQDAARRRKY